MWSEISYSIYIRHLSRLQDQSSQNVAWFPFDVRNMFRVTIWYKVLAFIHPLHIVSQYPRIYPPYFYCSPPTPCPPRNSSRLQVDKTLKGVSFGPEIRIGNILCYLWFCREQGVSSVQKTELRVFSFNSTLEKAFLSSKLMFEVTGKGGPSDPPLPPPSQLNPHIMVNQDSYHRRELELKAIYTVNILYKLDI